MRKILSLVLALALVLGSFSFAFAAQDDVAGHEYETAIKRLNALGLMIGDSRGFRPDDTITRAEFATLIVRALGEEATAKLLTGAQTGFTDVDSVNHWASGYIKVAAQKGLINGYGNGLFGPDDNIKVVDAIVLMTRALGYEPKAENLGGYPIGNLTVANELDINDGIDSPGSALATRGEVAKLFDNSLTVPFMVRTTWGDTAEYSVPDEDDDDYTFILNEIGATSVEGRVVSTPSFGGEDEDEVVLFWIAEDSNGNEVEKTATISNVENADELLGHEVTIWVNSDDEALLVEDETETIFDFTAVELNSDDDAVVDEDDNEYVLAEDAKVVVNRQPAVDLDDLTDIEGEQATVILNGDDEVAFAVVFEPDAGDRVVEVSTKHKVVEFDNLRDLELEDYDSVLIYKDGEVAELDDIDEDDVLYYAEDIVDGDDVLLVRVFDDKVEGEVTKVSSDEEAIYIDGEEYALASDCDYFQDAEGLIGDEVVALLDRVGDVLFIDLVEEDEEDEPDNFAIFEGSEISAVETKFGEDTFTAEFKLFLPSDESVIFDVVTTDDLTLYDTNGDEIDIDADHGDGDGDVEVSEIHAALTALFTGPDMLVTYELNDDGEIDTITIVNNDITSVTAKDDYDFDVDRARFVKGATSIELNEDEIVFDITGSYAAYTYADLVDGNTYDFYIPANYDGVIVITEGTFEDADTAIAFYTGYAKVADGFEVSLYLDGEEVELFVDEDDVDMDTAGITENAVVEVTLDGEDLADITTTLSSYNTVATDVYVQKVTTSKIYVVNPSDISGDVTKSKIDDADATVYYFEDITDYYLNDGDDVDILDKGDIEEYQMITIYINSDDEVEVIEVKDLDVLD
jgi:hypothetical protein